MTNSSFQGKVVEQRMAVLSATFRFDILVAKCNRFKGSKQLEFAIYDTLEGVQDHFEQ